MSVSAQAGTPLAPVVADELDGDGSSESDELTDGEVNGDADGDIGTEDAEVGDGLSLTVAAVLCVRSESGLPEPPHENAMSRMKTISPAATIARRRQ
jgi:hypothetical protein